MSNLKIISSPIIEKNQNYYLAGTKYLQFISFIGCSPYINFEPKDKITLHDLTNTIPNLNYIQFDFNKDNYNFKKTEYAVKALCPKCKSKIVDWPILISEWQTSSEIDCTCPQCKQLVSIIDIDWKKTAGFYLSAILFYGIQAELAIPDDKLLFLLEQETKVKWHYFYG